MKIIIWIILIAGQINSYSQQEFKGIVNYGHKKSLGMGTPIGIDYNAQLVFNAFLATYTYNKDDLEGGHVNEMKSIRKNEKQAFIVGKKTTEIGLAYHMDRDTDLFKNRDIGYFYVKDSIPKMKWEIHDDTKKIGDFQCSKATTNFRGRDYTAWFSTDIPLPYGPWKLHGLPGLILEAYDTHKEIFFYFKSIEYPTSQDIDIFIPEPESEGKDWISSEKFKSEMIKRYEKAIISGRMFSEQSSAPTKSKKKMPMKNLFIEVFD
ncbi:GLPGLI family protein [Aggregatimonas sangjinii]|uniref:GLPGLI family protein n=1 Tax=Aggregatimonas sangjinii TaxID=2583587 RepID=A0A5B7SYQ1_9FLAO|nr:GLPGLI family protein [Aggregatimonas sangjinii]QCX02208.1 GLPGLI family protein [Aggregatimonas sangjinii]